ncbi:MAG: hypothetical protein M3Z66_20625 [Chloroflexota bacterium]|nr:hypothetical protein [Chloroflexota bacterium]
MSFYDRQITVLVVQGIVFDLVCSDLIHEVSYVDEYAGSWVPEGHRSLTLRVVLRPTEATLTAEETGDPEPCAGRAQPGTGCPPAIAGLGYLARGKHVAIWRLDADDGAHA